ncbi:MAG: hypothetical protein Q8O67_05980 [Deltaproteobacteria bacterium]|nr:hypothetical protein [Deltaproteobacteria bacterium]
MGLLLLVCLAFASTARAAVDENSASLVTELVTAALGKEQGFEVLSSADVRRQLELEADKQSLGCDANASSCLAEIAGAMGAQLVVYGKLGELDDVVILTLNLFDSAQGRAAGRVAMREPNLKALSNKVDAAVAELVAPSVTKLVAGTTTKLLVLDIEAPKKVAVVVVDPVPPPEPGDPLFSSGLVGVIGGVVVAGAGGVLTALAYASGADADDPKHDAIRANELYDQRDTFGVIGLATLAVGGAVVVVGGGLLGVAAVVE